MQYCHLKTLHMHDLAKNASGEGKIILPLFFPSSFFIGLSIRNMPLKVHPF